MKIFILFLSLPLLISARLAIKFNLFRVSEDLKKCIVATNQMKTDIPPSYVKILIAAEDHRFLYHYGIDPIAIMRAIYIRLTKKQIQGASTIEQQLVRVVLNRYERTIYRKIKEQILAINLSKISSKENIAITYLSIAHYGTSYQGKDGIQQIINKNIHEATREDMINIVARLKYPEPITHTYIWKQKLERRIKHIESKITFVKSTLTLHSLQKL